MNPIYLLLEFGAATFFVLAAWLALRRGRLPLLELISAATFGLLLEEGDQLIFATYHYADAWVLSIDRAPLVIGLTWALIIAGAMRITDALGVRRRWAPFVDSVLAIMLDLAFDAIAIRMGLWTWREIPLDRRLVRRAGRQLLRLAVRDLGIQLLHPLAPRRQRVPSGAGVAPAPGPDPGLRPVPLLPGAVQRHQAARGSGARRRPVALPDHPRRVRRSCGLGRLRAETAERRTGRPRRSWTSGWHSPRASRSTASSLPRCSTWASRPPSP